MSTYAAILVLQRETISIGQTPKDKITAHAHLKQMGWCGLNCAPKKDMLKSLPLAPMNVTLFRNRVLAVISDYDEVILD